MVGCKDQKQDDETGGRCLFDWFVANVRKFGMHVLWGGRMVGCKVLKQSYACIVEEEVGQTQRAEISTARNSDGVDC